MQMLPILENGEETLVGGQAVMEGVMMRAPHSYCVAVRKPNGEMVTEEKPLARMSERHPIFKLPIFRGVGTLYQAMKLGIKALNFSTNAALDDPTIPAEKRRPKEIPNWAIAGPLFCLGVVHLPLQVHAVAAGHQAHEGLSHAGRPHCLQPGRWPDPHRHLPGFLYGLSRMKDIRRISSITARSIKWSSISNRASL